MRELLNYLSERSLSPARQTRSRIFQGISLFTEFPLPGKSVDEVLMPGRRYLIIEEYIVLYVISEEEIHIQRLVSEKQDLF
ncbi:type II toxin-antitoxin system RelE/ParE family toxin [Emergencia timonensis]|uniref:type II toxin-antitoxin system RelE/ParE family toxin n=1 Tax=Emergencia timonensis TaxID=1776384 RepID=UPI00399396D0